jgi:hypothetical protein
MTNYCIKVSTAISPDGYLHVDVPNCVYLEEDRTCLAFVDGNTRQRLLNIRNGEWLSYWVENVMKIGGGTSVSRPQLEYTVKAKVVKTDTLTISFDEED